MLECGEDAAQVGEQDRNDGAICQNVINDDFGACFVHVESLSGGIFVPFKFHGVGCTHKHGGCVESSHGHVVKCVEAIRRVAFAATICQYPVARSNETKYIMPGGISSTASSHLGIGYA